MDIIFIHLSFYNHVRGDSKAIKRALVETSRLNTSVTSSCVHRLPVPLWMGHRLHCHFGWCRHDLHRPEQLGVHLCHHPTSWYVLDGPPRSLHNRLISYPYIPLFPLSYVHLAPNMMFSCASCMPTIKAHSSLVYLVFIHANRPFVLS